MDVATDVRLVLIRHGESVWNAQARFAGWADIDLTFEGIAQARRAGQALAEYGWGFDLALTSSLTRSIRTQWLIADRMESAWVPVVKDWRLNERHYGALTGMSKVEALRSFGEKDLDHWRYGFFARPAPLVRGEYAGLERHARYHEVPADQLPLTESIADTAHRVDDLWLQLIAPALLAGKRILVCAHGTSLRAMVRRIEQVPNEQVAVIAVPNAMPLAYAFKAPAHPVNPDFPASALRRVDVAQMVF